MSSCSSSCVTSASSITYSCPSSIRSRRTQSRNVIMLSSSSSSQTPTWDCWVKLKHKSLSSSSSMASLSKLFLRYPSRPSLRRPQLSPVMQWQDCTVKMDVDVPASVAFNCYSDRESIPRWMPFISSVKVLEDKPDLSRWSLKYKAFGRDIEFSWLARNMQPIPNQKLHWRSMEGLPNRGVVRFYPKSPSSCTVELTVSYEVPPILTPVASALEPFLEGLLRRGLERFSTFAKSYK